MKKDIKPEKGRFIAFEGLDGSGKTTQFNAISGKLAAIQIKCKEEKEPSNRNPVGLMLRDIVKTTHGFSLSPLSLAKLFAIDRYEHVKNDIRPYIDMGEHVLIDRYVFSSFAYQGLAFSFEEIYALNRDAIELLMPDLTVFIDTTPEECLHRINNNRDGKELFDSKGAAVREKFFSAFDAFDKMKNRARVLVVDGNQPADVVTEEIWRAVELFFAH